MEKKGASQRDAYELSVEINAVSMIVRGLANQNCDECDRLTEASLQTALYGVSSLLDRIANDLKEIE